MISYRRGRSHIGLPKFGNQLIDYRGSGNFERDSVAYYGDDPSDLVRVGLVAEYKFDDGFGNVINDYSGNGNHGTLVEGTWVDEGLNLTGVNDYAVLPNIPSSQGTITLVCTPYIPTWSGDYGALWLVGTPSWNDNLFFGLNSTSYNLYGRARIGSEPSPYRWRFDNKTSGIVGSFELPRAFTLIQDGTGPLAYVGTMERNLSADGANLSAWTDANNWETMHMPASTGAGTARHVAHYMLVYNRALSQEEIVRNHRHLERVLQARGVILS